MVCRLRPQYTFSHSRKSQPPLLGMVALAIALPPPSVHEIRLESDMFVTRINFDFRIAHCEPKVSDLLDYSADELTGRNLYTLCHGEDANKLRKCHIDRKPNIFTRFWLAWILKQLRGMSMQDRACQMMSVRRNVCVWNKRGIALWKKI